MDRNRYRGDGLPPKGSKNGPYPYLANDDLARVVNMAIMLRRPLLIKGPPGCGKTQLAYAIAHELDVPLYKWYVKSTTRARDGLYLLDMIKRLHDAQVQDPNAKDLANYVKLQALGQAFMNPGESVVLIDEIDKADIDFPNDLLRELEEKTFDVVELEDGHPMRTYQAIGHPIIIITSNDEKELPDAFLRRCLFYQIPFPSEERLKKIINVNLAAEKHKIETTLVNAAVRRLIDMREVEGYRKSPSTSELIDWVKVLHFWGSDVSALEKNALSKLPYLETLFKYQQDLHLLQRLEEEDE
ncbi:MAG: AAA family ATPase [Calditrichia bacterium]